MSGLMGRTALPIEIGMSVKYNSNPLVDLTVQQNRRRHTNGSVDTT